jgi:uncharacterized protein YaeQ
VLLYAYGERALAVWHQKHADALQRFSNLSLYGVSDEELDALGALASPGMELQCSIASGELWITDGRLSLEVKPRPL